MNRPLAESLRAALQTNRLEPEIDDATLLAYAEGVASPVDREIVETMMEVDPAFAEAVAAVREALEEARTPLPDPPPAPAARARSAFAWLLPAASFAALAGAIALVLFQNRKQDRVAILAPEPPVAARPKRTMPHEAESEPQSDAAIAPSAAPGASARLNARKNEKGSFAPARRPQSQVDRRATVNESKAEDALARGIVLLSRGKIDEARKAFRALARTEPALAARLLKAIETR